MFTLKDCFNDKGNIKFDPYRELTTKTEIALNALLFDDNGFIRDKTALAGLIRKNSWNWNCHAVALFHADDLAKNTKGSYPTYYYFR